ncbi:MAG TPA: DUF177 domain-containing protein [Candidatus Binatia bacterium]|nr:DUF177 domain-containing protein [Candidatus Binatia bacterium]
MIVRVPDLTEEVRRVDFREPASALNARLSESPGWDDQHFGEDAGVVGEIYRIGSDVHFSGEVATTVRSACPRCLEEFTWPLRRKFRFVIVPAPAGVDPEDDDGIDHYSGDDLDLSPLVGEQALLALDHSLLCSEGCRGLCAGCGANLNQEDCGCAPKH